MNQAATLSAVHDRLPAWCLPCRIECSHEQLASFVCYARVLAIAAGEVLEFGVETSYMESELSGRLVRIEGAALLSTGLASYSANGIVAR